MGIREVYYGYTGSRCDAGGASCKRNGTAFGAGEDSKYGRPKHEIESHATIIRKDTAYRFGQVEIESITSLNTTIFTRHHARRRKCRSDFPQLYARLLSLPPIVYRLVFVRRKLDYRSDKPRRRHPCPLSTPKWLGRWNTVSRRCARLATDKLLRSIRPRNNPKSAQRVNAAVGPCQEQSS